MPAAPPQRIDSHCHLWQLSRGDYGWLDATDPALQPIAKDFGLTDLQRADPDPGAAQYIVVQAAPTIEETEFLLQLARETEKIGAVVGWVDLGSESAEQQLEALCKNPEFRGIRPMLQDIENTNWINTVPRPEVIKALTAKNLRFDALVLPQHLSALLTFALANPNLPIVIDHAAKPALAAEASDPRHAMWREGMALLAKETNACCKVSGLLTELAAEQRSAAAELLQPVIDDLLQWFGPDRLMWGSDWPVLNLAASYQDWHSLSTTLLSRLDAQQQLQVYAGTAQRFYNLDNAT